MAHTIYDVGALRVRYSSINGELWFSGSEEKRFGDAGTLNLNDDRALKRLIKALVQKRNNP